MADIMESLSEGILKLLQGNSRTKAIVSDAPGTGPESQIANKRVVIERSHGGTLPLGYLAEHPGLGRGATGFGGGGDAILTDEETEESQLERIHAENERIARVATRIKDRTPSGKVRMGRWYWLESHSDQTVGPVVGPFSLFDGTVSAPGAGNSQQIIPVTMPANTVSPIFLLDRYPGAMYMSLFISSFAFMPVGTTMTGLQECWFQDVGGATAGLGLYNATGTNAQDYNNINKQLSSPMTDPGLSLLGNITVNNISIGGTPVASRWQISIGYMAFFPDPWFNEQMVVPMTKRENVRMFLPDDLTAQ